MVRKTYLGNSDDAIASGALGRIEGVVGTRDPAGEDVLVLQPLHNKIYVGGEPPRAVGNEIWLSAKTGAGLDLLREKLLEAAGWQAAGEGAFMARARHLDALDRAAGHLDAARESAAQLDCLPKNCG